MVAPKFKNKHLNASPHLGWKPTPEGRRAKIPRLDMYMKRMAAGVLPAEFDYSDSALASFLTMLGNNQKGDCTIAAVLKQIGLASANRPAPKELVSNDNEALTQYPTICGPGDQGCYVPDVLDWWRDKGMKCGGVTTKILGYVSVNTGNELEIAKSIYLFNSLHCGLFITQKQYEDAAPDAVWDDDGAPIIGGHSIPLAGRKAQGWRLGTWAMKLFITQAAIAASRSQAELYAVVDEQSFNQAGINSFGVDANAMKADLAIIAAGGDVPIPDPTPTPPSPEPTPPTPSQLQLTGTLDFFNQMLPIQLSGPLSAAIAAKASTPAAWFQILADLALLVLNIQQQNWAGVIAAVEQLLTDLGITWPAAAKDEMAKCLMARK